ncbi:MAG: hypothetical protein QXL69_04750 [Candidatus Bathyarchaeia archaeon]|nr:hypothetical protein [Candidatus Bathyarchaeota archaeon]
MNEKRIVAAITLTLILFFVFFSSTSVGKLKVTIIAKGGLEVKATIIDLKVYSFNWENITDEINLTFTNKSETLTVLLPTGNYNKVKFRIVNALINLNGNLTSLKVFQEEFIIESNFTIKLMKETKMIIELRYDEELLTQQTLNLTAEIFIS